MVRVYIYTDSGSYTITNHIFKTEFSGQDRSDVSLPSWGIKSNSGNIEFSDTQKIYKSINSKSTITFSIYSKEIGTFYVTEVQFDEQTNRTKLSFQDVLKDWSNTETLGIDVTQNTTAYDVLTRIPKPSGTRINIADTATENHLKAINIPFSYLEDGSFWNLMTKFCELTMCYIYCNNLGTPQIKYNEGR